jgi:hypothetical protein
MSVAVFFLLLLLFCFPIHVRNEHLVLLSRCDFYLSLLRACHFSVQSPQRSFKKKKKAQDGNKKKIDSQSKICTTTGQCRRQDPILPLLRGCYYCCMDSHVPCVYVCVRVCVC